MESDKLMVLLGQEVTPIMQELVGRLEGEMSPSDRLAVVTALQKTLVAGAAAGALEMFARLQDDPDASPIGLSWELPMGDQWAREREVS